MHTFFTFPYFFRYVRTQTIIVYLKELFLSTKRQQHKKQ